jgi:MFS family permease
MYAATASSDLADGIGRTALPLAAAFYTRSPVVVSGLMTFAFLPWLLFALPSGALVDRVDRRHAMAWANLVRAAAVGVLALLVMLHVGSIAALYVVAFVLGVAETVYDSGVRALLPQVVARTQLDGRTAWSPWKSRSARRSSARRSARRCSPLRPRCRSCSTVSVSCWRSR